MVEKIGLQQPWFVQEYALKSQSSTAAEKSSGGNNTVYNLICEELFHKYFDGLPLKLPFQQGSVGSSSGGSAAGSALDEALRLAVALDDRFGQRIAELLQQRVEMLKRIDQGQIDQVLKLEQVNPSWRSSRPLVKNFAEYEGCVLEMTGNALNRMGINSFNYINSINDEISKITGDAKPRVCWMCCGEDANGAQVESILENIRHFRDLITGEAKYQMPGGGKLYQLNSSKIPPISFRPRGMHCVEAHLVNSRTQEPIVGPLLDLALWTKFVLPELLQRNVCPLLYIPKMQQAAEASVWQEILDMIEQAHGLPLNTIKIVFLAETFPAIFQLPRMIEAFQGRCIGVNCGRWDYLFSYVQVLAEHVRLQELDGQRNINTALPNKHDVTTDVNLLKKYQVRTAQICHKYGIMFIGGMNATLPSQDRAENERVFNSSIKNKSEERTFYGASKTWVAHIFLLEIAKTLIKVPHNVPIDKQIRDIVVTRPDLFRAPSAETGEVPKAYNLATFKHDIHVVLLYMAMYLLNRNGAVAIDNKMEDMATAEISMSLIWYYLRHGLLRNELAGVAGGVNGLIDSVAKQSVRAEILSKVDKKQVSEQRVDKLLGELIQIVQRMSQDRSVRPSLEKILYALGTRDDPSDGALQVLQQSKRFPTAASAGSLARSVTSKL